MANIEQKYQPPGYRAKAFRYQPADEYGNVNLQQFMLDFQEVAGLNADDLDIGPSYYFPNKVYFVIVRMKGEFLKPVPFDRDIHFVTFSLPLNEKIQFYRQAFACDYNEEVYFSITSSWVLISAEKRRIITTDALKEHLEPVEPYIRDHTPIMEQRLRALETLDAPEDGRYVYQVDSHDIDNNSHMNNTVYFKIMQNCGFRNRVAGFEIDFEKESFLGQKIATSLIPQKNSDYYIGYKEDGQLSFKARVNY